MNILEITARLDNLSLLVKDPKLEEDLLKLSATIQTTFKVQAALPKLAKANLKSFTTANGLTFNLAILERTGYEGEKTEVYYFVTPDKKKMLYSNNLSTKGVIASADTARIRKLVSKGYADSFEFKSWV